MISSLRDWGIRLKLLTCFGILLLLFVAGTFASLRGLWLTARQITLLSHLGDISRGVAHQHADVDTETDQSARDAGVLDIDRIRRNIETLLHQSGNAHVARLREVVGLLDQYADAQRRYHENSEERDRRRVATQEAFDTILNQLHDAIYAEILQERNNAIVFGTEIPAIFNEIQDAMVVLIGAIKDVRLYENAYLVEGHPDYLQEIQTHLLSWDQNQRRASFLIEGAGREDFSGAWAAATEAASRYNQDTLDALLSLADATRSAQQEIGRTQVQIGAILAEIQAELQHAVALSVRRTERMAVLFLAFGLVTGILSVIFFSRSLVRPIVRCVSKMKSIADDGDLTANISTQDLSRRDEIGDLSRSLHRLLAFDQSIEKTTAEMAAGNWQMDVSLRSQEDSLGKGLQKLIHQVNEALCMVRSAVAAVSSGSGQISDASQNLSQGATETAASLEEISSSATEIGQQARTNAETATQANQLALDAKASAETGAERMAALNQSMEAITESSAQIAKIIKTIDDIAFQTNILALNAAVEAARAGRHGKGFAVVAEEVRGLAARSAKAARETANLIEGSKNRVDEGNNIARETAEALTEIVAGIVKVGDLVGEMAAASNEQAQGIAQISQGLGQIDQVTQQNTATAEETAAAAEELSGQADELHGLISQFKLKGGDSGAQATRPKGAAARKPGFKPPPPRQALPDAAKPAAKPGNESGWEAMARKAAPVKPVSNEEIISLEDKEFGRY